MPLSNAAASQIKSIQSGSKSLPTAGTGGSNIITAVNLSKSVCIFQGASASGGLTCTGMAYLQDATTVATIAGAANAIVNWTVIEYV